MDNLIFLIKSAIIGVVEGITEFLPISSTGHIIIFQNLLGFKGDNETYVNMYAYVIQLGAILAVVVLYWRKIKETLLNFFPGKVGYEKSGFKFWFMIVIACIPGAVVQLTLDDLADKYLFNTVSVAITLVLGAVWMLYAENRFRNVSGAKEININPKQAIIIGLFQCLAIIPGMSRSASTIIGGWIAGLSTVAAAEFSFFLAIPVMMGMSLLKFIKIGGVSTLTSIEIMSLVVGFLVSFIVALIVIKKFIEYLKKKPMKVFVIYRMVFGIMILIAGFSGLFSIS
ncbi:undecaprenyl-diphosphate phosphatase [Clostridium intestinale]|uniref:Undecaprenyl-diphosphatase n=1 Tax=Clostridium intestinale DSM 6191 TaxID=1121320 RepID=A0A1M5YQ60_9CLOT|nr:undecaprenyl-diphosphate phosphatase [Clostridium intestinale]SHI14029.1 undecaprenyl-diphosphatase [Clostridium intestinale DSM 6191]